MAGGGPKKVPTLTWPPEMLHIQAVLKPTPQGWHRQPSTSQVPLAGVQPSHFPQDPRLFCSPNSSQFSQGLYRTRPVLVLVQNHCEVLYKDPYLWVPSLDNGAFANGEDLQRM